MISYSSRCIQRIESWPPTNGQTRLGMNAMLEIVHRFGLATLSDTERYGLSLTLGGGEVRLLDLTNAYAALGAGGVFLTQILPFADSKSLQLFLDFETAVYRSLA